MKDPISVELLEKYIKGLCTDEEIARVKAWYFSFEHEADYVSALSPEEEEKLEELIYNRVLTNIGHNENEEDEEYAEEPGRSNRRWWYAAAGAAAAVLIVFGVWFGKLQMPAGAPVTDNAQAQELVVISNNTRQIYKAVLPDASMVWLNPGAQLRFPRAFADGYRAVTMSGECFFEVTKNPKRPFIISSRAIITKVWGTSFRVRDNVKSNSADVAVLTGKVSVSIKGNSSSPDEVKPVLTKDEVMLYPNQKVTYLVDQNILRPENAPQANMRIWNRINLNFENKPLSEIIPVLNARFNVHLKTVNEKLNHYILNADMAGFNLPDVLEALKKSLNVNYEIKDNVIELE